jgi:hypothetical protein
MDLALLMSQAGDAEFVAHVRWQLSRSPGVCALDE